MMTIEILGFRHCKELDFLKIAENVVKVYSFPTFFRNAVLDVGLSFDPKREQYNSLILIDLIRQSKTKDVDSKIIGVTDIDLFIPTFKYVFAESDLNGDVAIVSSYRMHNEFYGLHENLKLLENRIQKEILHELGHTFGLIHCSNNFCVMYSSTYFEHIDFKGNDLCDSCKNLL